MAYLLTVFFATGILFGNLNSLAMEPLGHIAGMASSVIGCVTTLMALTLGFFIGNLYDHNLMPVVSGFAVLSVACLLLISISRESRRAGDGD